MWGLWSGAVIQVGVVVRGSDTGGGCGQGDSDTGGGCGQGQ